MADHAIELVETLGVAVFPAKVTKDGQKMSHRSEERSGTKWGLTKDAKRIREDHKTLGNSALIGIATGATTERDGVTYSLVVIDVDEKEGGVSGVDSWAALQALNFGDPIETPIARTTSGGGRHLYLLVPADVGVRNSQGVFGKAELGVEATGIDVRGNGGMVLAPPSINPVNLKGYEWEVSPFDVPLAIAPEWVVEELRRIEASRDKKKPGRPTNAEKERREDVELIEAMGVKGTGHEAVRDFSARWAAKGAPKSLVEAVVRANAHTFDKNAQELIDSAYEKYSPEKIEPELGEFAIVDGDYYDLGKHKTRSAEQMWRLTQAWDMQNLRGEDVGPAKEKRLQWLNDSLAHYAGLVFDPGAGAMVENPKGRPPGVYVNTFKPLRRIPYEGREPKPWLDHLAVVVPDKGDREWVVEWLAFVVQNRGRKVNWAPVFIGEEGSGKDTLFRPLTEWFGDYMHPAVKLRDVTDTFNAWMHETLVGLVQEKDGNRFTSKSDQAEALKNLIAAPPDMVSLRLMRRDAYLIPNIVNVAFFVNSADALAIDRHSRRYFPVESPWQPADEDEDAAYFGPLHDYLDNGGCDEVIAFLQAYPIKRVHERMRAPRASMFDAIVDQGLGPLGEALLELLEERDWVTMAEAAFHVSHITESKNVVAKALKEIGFRRVDVPGDPKGRLRYRTGGGQRVAHVIYARDARGCPTEEIKAKLEEGEE